MFPSPLADETNEQYHLFVTTSKHVTLTMPLYAFLQQAASVRARPILVTPVDAHLSWFVAEELRLCGGFWVAQTPDGIYDTRNGYRLSVFEELWGPVDLDAPRLESFSELNPQAEAALFFDVFTRERAQQETQVGAVLEHCVAGLGGSPLRRWDETEPLGSLWSRPMITERVRSQMPASARQLARSAGGACGALTLVRTDTGLMEHSRGLVPVGLYSAPLGLPDGAPLAGHPRITETLRGLAEGFRVNIAMISVAEVVMRGDVAGQRAGRRRVDRPLAVLIGPTAARDLRLDLAELRAKYDLVTFGLQRAPSVLVRFTGATELWRQFVAFGHDLDQARLAQVLGPGLYPQEGS